MLLALPVLLASLLVSPYFNGLSVVAIMLALLALVLRVREHVRRNRP